MPRHPGVTLAAVLFVASPSLATELRPSRGERCAANKLKAVAKKTTATLACYEKAVLAGAAVDPTCLMKADAAFAAAFQSAEAKSGCATTGDAATLEAQVDGFVRDAVAELPPTTTTTTSTTTTTIVGTCAFKGAPCHTDADCGIPGVCFAGSPGGVYPPGSCLIRCASNADCTAQTFCFTTALLGPICVGCGEVGSEDSSKCAPDMTCVANDCHQLDHPECITNGTRTDCTITDPCVPTP